MQIGGKERELRFGFGALRRLNRMHEMGIAELMAEVKNGRVDYIVDIMWAALLHDSPDVEIDTVADWLDEIDDLDALMGELAESIPASLSAEKKKH